MLQVLEKSVTSNIPKEYKKFKKLFLKEIGLEALPKHQE